VHIIDATLREGAQAPGVTWTPAASVEIARDLDRLGVDTIECGHPSVGPSERDRIRAVLDAGLATPVLVHARARPEDIDAARQIGAPWVGLFRGVNPVSRRARVPSNVPPPLDQIAGAIRHAKDAGLRVRFTLEDASRTDPDESEEAFAAAIDSGADRICYADTVGVAEPADVALAVGRMRARFPAVPVEVHLHDDRGLALANALAALDAGAEWVSTSVLGLGERCGIVDLTALLANVAVRGLRAWPDGDTLQRVARAVATHSGQPPDVRRPVIGENAFTHTAKLHVKAMNRDPASYSWTDPARLGRKIRT